MVARFAVPDLTAPVLHNDEMMAKESAKMEDFSSQEKLVETYLNDNKKEQAVELLFDLIGRCAQAHDFAKAESLRERLFEVDSMALDEIVKSAEIIENAKLSAIDEAHMETWSNLYKHLTKEESITLYYGMQSAVYESEQILFRQGELNPNLYFINAGQVKSFYHKDKHAILLKTLGPGDLAGEDTFFTNSTCTTSVMAHSTVKLRFADKTVLQKWQANAPNLANKLQDYCTGLESIKDLLLKKELERRTHPRYAIAGNASVQILDQQDSKAFKADLSDISSSGVSFIMNTSPTAADSLLGCRLTLKCTLRGSFPEIRIDQEGRIVGVHAQLFNEYFINVKWEEQLEDGLIDKIKAYG
ncbi:MAG: cyclic nucleotide-binding domain-containing protein [Deltaproteobacteria bacterium]|nr:cyclic nucleotide-binding domain-containing protein [Deltaproteobacteria bacterium]